MTWTEVHRAINLVGLITFLFCWSWSLMSHRFTFSRRQVVVSAALIPFFVVASHGTWRAWQTGAPVTADTWGMTVSLILVLGAMAAPRKWFHDRAHH